GPDLDRAARADRTREQRHEGALLGRDLHQRDPAQALRLLDQLPLHGVGRRAVAHQVVVHGGGEVEGVGGAGHRGAPGGAGGLGPSAGSISAARMPPVPPRSSDARLRAEVRFAGTVLGEVLREQEGERLFALVEQVRGLAIALRREYQAREERRLRLLLADLSLDDLALLTRAFTLFFQLVNVCEQRAMARGADRDAPDGLAALLARLRARGPAAEPAGAALAALRATVVLTAHPTEATRWTVHEILHRIGDALEALADDAAGARVRLARDVTALWQTQPLRGRRPTPIDEVQQAIHTLETVLV